MLGRSMGAVLCGVTARAIDVEVDLPGGLPIISAVGLPDSAVREGIDRIRSALGHVQLKLPDGRIVVNLAPADLRKQGAALDLPIAVALLRADGKLRALPTESAMVAGELALDGRLRGIRGALAVASLARALGKRTLIVPQVNADEAALVPDLDVLAIDSLSELLALGDGAAKPPHQVDAQALLDRRRGVTGDAPAMRPARHLDLRDVRGQPSARRALEIAAAGGHHLLLNGPPGSGKTMLAKRLPGILPPLELDEALEITRVWSAAGLSQGLVTRRPFRAPHHGISFAGMTGGGTTLRPGEMSLASGGVLYLDELTEFRRDTLEALRQPLEERTIRVVRVHATATFPADFMLVASMNPCACGYYGHPDGRCGCTERDIQRYRRRLSGPLLDRFDLVVEVPPVDLRSFATADPGEASEAVMQRVEEARQCQHRRYKKEGAAAWMSNGRLDPAGLQRHGQLDAQSRALLTKACKRLGLSARGFDRVRRVARTVADLDAAATIEAHHVAEALQYRRDLER